MRTARLCWLCAIGFGLMPMAVPVLAAAQDFGQVASSVLTLDQERLFNGSRVAARVAVEIERRSTELAAENREIEAKLVAEELDLTKRRPTLTPEEFRPLADAFDQKVQQIRAKQDAKAQELQRLGEEERQNFLRRITPILARIVRERGAVVILDRRSVFLSADTIDITDEAISRINDVLDAETDPHVEPSPKDTPPPDAPPPAPGVPANPDQP
jgi:Skp family chaperone for outer membrane proteins